MTRVAILISGRGSNMMALVEQARHYQVVLVASDRPDAAGLDWARARGIATWAMSPKGMGKPAFEAALHESIVTAGVEVIALAGYMRLLSNGFVERWRGRILNVHPSLLPLYKGLDTHARALAAGDRQAGCSVHLVTEELDGGAVLGQARVPVLAGDTPDTLADRVLAAEHVLYPRTLSEFTMDPLDRVRAVAMQLPEAEEQSSHDRPSFVVAGREFAQLRQDENGDGRIAIRVLAGDGDQHAAPTATPPDTHGGLARPVSPGWMSIDLSGDVDWPLVEDRIAHSWELAAPARLLEAGGR